MDEKKSKKTYQKPTLEILNLQLEQPILTGSGSDFGDGGSWGFNR